MTQATNGHLSKHHLIENAASIVNDFAYRAGILRDVFFEDITLAIESGPYSVLHQPCLAVLVVDSLQESASDGGARINTEDPPVLWFEQPQGNIIPEVYATIHAACNSNEPVYEESPMGNLLGQALPMTVNERTSLFQRAIDLRKAYTAHHLEFRMKDPHDVVAPHYVTFASSMKTNATYMFKARSPPFAVDACKVDPSWEHPSVLTENVAEHIRDMVLRNKSAALPVVVLALMRRQM